MRQPTAEKIERLRVLVPLVYDHLQCSRVTLPLEPVHGGDSELAAVVAEREWRLACMRYPVLRRIYRLMQQMEWECLPWWIGCYYTLCEPLNCFKAEQMAKWCECGLVWLAEQLWEVPEFNGLPQTPEQVGRFDRDAYVVSLVQKGMSYRAIAAEVGLEKSRIGEIWHAHLVRSGRTTSADS